VKKLVLFGVPIVLVMAGAIFVLLVAANLYTYQRLTAETPIAILSFRRIGNQEFDVIVRNGNACAIGAYRLYGDQWRIDAQFLKWRPWAALIGFDSMYRLERLSGRYRDVRDENSKNHVAYDLSAPSVIELADLAKAFSGMFSPVDVVYGSSTYLDIGPASSTDTVYKTQSGLVARVVQRATDTGGAACNAKDSFWQRVATRLETLISAISSIMEQLKRRAIEAANLQNRIACSKSTGMPEPTAGWRQDRWSAGS
jgi:hypothetical protein